MRAVVGALIGILAIGSATTALAQRRGGFGGGFGGRRGREAIRPNTPYDGKFTFVRVRYGPDYGFASQGLPWSHDYPTGEQHFMKIVNELSFLNPHTERAQASQSGVAVRACRVVMNLGSTVCDRRQHGIAMRDALIPGQ